MPSFLDDINGLFTGSNPTLNKDQNQTGALAGFNTQQGEGDVNDASQFYQDILSGDPTKQAKALAPEISAGQVQGQQQKNNMAQFGTRSGGTASSAAGIDAGNRSDIIKDIGGLQSSAASGAASLGSNQTSQAATNLNTQSTMSQEQLQNFIDSIVGGTITGGVAAGAQALHI